MSKSMVTGPVSISISASMEREGYMNRKAVVDWTREAIGYLIEIEQIWIESTPDYELDDDKRKELKDKIEKVKKRMDKILEVYYTNS